ncbi:MAG TPA: Ig-like domain-containing protein [Parafilimonas sp.]|nr:Ig-like domain-containing protein [Parafilimonas sp.]
MKNTHMVRFFFKRYFPVLFLLMGFTGYVNAQNIDFTAGCPNNPADLKEQEVGTPISSSGMWAIPTITAINPPGGAAITMSIQTIDVFFGGLPQPGEGCSSCASPVTIHGINFTTSGANFTITGTPDGTSAGYSFSVTIRASAGGTNCDRTYSFNIVASGSHSGDPHVTTVNGINYDFQSAGEFTLLRGDSGSTFEIQTRQTAVATNSTVANPYTGLSTCVSVNTAVAARVGTHRVSFQPNINGNPDSSGMQLRVDGKLTTPGDNGIDLESGGRILSSAGGGIEIDFPDGASLVATPLWWSYYNVWLLNLNVYRTRATKGIMGIIRVPIITAGITHISETGWLPLLPDGSSVGPMPEGLHERFTILYQKFADAWRVTDKTSLFDYAPGTSTSTFTDKNWPIENPESCIFGNKVPKQPIALEEAQKLCADILDPNMKANAIFDVMVTGEPTFTKIYLLTQETQNTTTATTVDAGKDTTKHGEPVTFTAAVARKFLAGKDVLAGSVEFTADGKKLDQVKLDANGLAVLTTTALEVGTHQIVARFIPDSGSPVLSSSSLGITHIVTGTNGLPPILREWWLWLLILIILGIIMALLRKKKNP